MSKVPKYILIGDPHVKRDNLEESRRLILWIKSLCVEHGLRPIFMGDQANDHGTVRVEVLEFWDWAFSLLAEDGPVYLLVGNHDMNHECTDASMRVYRHIKNVFPIGVQGMDIPAGSVRVRAVGYFKSNDEFAQVLEMESKMASKVIVLCHQEVNGCQYENGYYSPHGLDPARIPSNIILVSGHIHKRQFLTDKDTGRPVVLYTGTPRQQSTSEAGDNKFLHVTDFSFQADGNISMQALPVPEEVCETFKVFDIDPNNAHVMANVPQSGRVLVNVKGPKDFINEITRQLPDMVKTRTFPDKDRVEVKVKESEGIPKAFVAFGRSYFEAKNVKEEVAVEALKKVYDKCPFLKGAS